MILKKSDSVAIGSLLVLGLSIAFLYFAEPFRPILFNGEAVTFGLPNAIVGVILLISIISSLLIFSGFWKNHYFSCQQDTWFNDFSDMLGCGFATVLLYVFPIFLSLISSFTVINGVLDNSPSYDIDTKVVEKTKNHSSKGGMHYSLILSSSGKCIYMPVTYEEYNQIAVNDRVMIKAKSGFFNIAWRQSYQLID